jgi:hypothetical protein
MQTLETTDAKVARRCRYDQHRFQETTLTIGGSLVTGLVHSVLEIKSSTPTRWLLTLIAKPGIARDQAAKNLAAKDPDHAPRNPPH